MSEPTFVVLPTSGNGVQNSDQETADITSTIQNALHKRANPEPEHPGPIKQMLAHQDSVYRYINWEDPIRTLGCYVGALSILFGAHYLPLTQVFLKVGVTALGAVSVTEFISRLLSTDSLSTRLRPKEYKVLPESTLNATLKDIHDLIQYAVVQAQRIVFGHDLNKTFAAFLGFTALYWLIQITPPFVLAVMGLTSIFVAPLVSSPQVRGLARDASVSAQEMSKVAVEKGRELSQDSKVKAAELSSRGQQAAADLSAQAKNTASDGKAKAAELSSRGQQAAADFSAQAKSTASDGKAKAAELSSRGKDSAADLSAQVRDTATDMSGTAVENIKKVSQMGPGQQNGVSYLSEQPRGEKRGSAEPVQYAAARDANATHGNVDGRYGAARPATGYGN